MWGVRESRSCDNNKKSIVFASPVDEQYVEHFSLPCNIARIILSFPECFDYSLF